MNTIAICVLLILFAMFLALVLAPDAEIDPDLHEELASANDIVILDAEATLAPTTLAGASAVPASAPAKAKTPV